MVYKIQESCMCSDPSARVRRANSIPPVYTDQQNDDPSPLSYQRKSLPYTRPNVARSRKDQRARKVPGGVERETKTKRSGGRRRRGEDRPWPRRDDD